MEKMMLSYLVHFIHAFIPVSLITAMLLALRTPLYGERKAARSGIVALAVGLLGGMIIYFVSLRQETATAARASVYSLAIIAALFNAGIVCLPEKRHRIVAGIGWVAALFFTAALAAVTIFSFLTFIAEQALSATTVLNTELILNIGGILTGVFLIAALIPLTARMCAKNGRGTIAGFFLLACALLVAQWSAEVLLGLMRLELVELTSLRLSVVAKVTKYSYLFPYIQLLIITALSLAFFTGRTVIETHDLVEMQQAERRKARSRILFEMRWFKSALASVAVILVFLLYYDVHASRPVKITPPVELTPDSGGLIKIRIDDVKDGNLHRYSYVTDDGHVVRFFLINRSMGEQNRIGVVFDACMLCGDMGYIQEKNENICIACNVRIFTPSIGKAGGCNPIPLQHKVEVDHIVVSVEDLDQGAHYFSQVVSRKVKDPVTGRELENSKAPHRYEYKGRTYFFESGESQEKFMKSPETYVGVQKSRYERVQGFRES
jgi:uncharacterized membrane protein/YHS domain-containing protein